MRVLITGGAGFLGSHLTKRLLDRGNEVLVIDNYSTGRRDNLVSHPMLLTVEGSIADSQLMGRLFSNFKPDFVVHAAASYKAPNDWAEDIATNVSGTVNIVRQSQNHSVKRLIYLQTALCYGVPRERPITLAHPLGPFTSYAISKVAGENFIAYSGLPYVSLRLANIYGPRHYSGPMPTFYKKLKAGESCTIVDTRRDFLEVGDFLDLIDTILSTNTVGCFNVSSGKDVRIKEIFDAVADHLGIRFEVSPNVVPPDNDDVAALLLDPSVTENTFGWKAHISLRDGLDRLLAWYDQYGVAAAYTHLCVGKR